MGDLISDHLLHAIEQGILGLLLALGGACFLIFTVRWRALGLAMAGAHRWRGILEQALAGNPAAGPGVDKAAAGETGSAERLARMGLGNSHLRAEALEKLLETQEVRERGLLEPPESAPPPPPLPPGLVFMDQPPRILFGAPPEYPERALDRGLEGTVVALITIDTSGTVTEVAVERSAGLDFDHRVRESARGTRFQPPIRNGRKVPARFRRPYGFRLE